MTGKNKQHVLIIGGGFGGVKAALELCEWADVAVTLLSDQPDFRYNPSLYHTATGGLRAQSSIALEKILPTDKVTLALGHAEKLDRKHKTITTQEGHIIPYDMLVLALGSVTNYFGIEGLQEFSFGIKSMEEVEEFKNHLHTQLTADHKPDLNYVIVGAGPTGIELAGALPEYLHKIMRTHGINHRAVHIDLIEAAPRLLPRSPKSISRAVKRQLKRLGVKLYVGQAVQGETADALTVNGKPITSHTVVWTAGMANNPFFESNNFTVDKRHKVAVDEHLQAEDSIYVIGDNASTPFSGMAQTALSDAKFVTADIEKQLASEKREAYKPKKPISIIPTGPEWAAVEWGKLHFAGKRGWILREAADWIGFHDLEPWWKATEQWATELGTEESCAACATAEQS
ncbi:MAG TPA: FAD-dependent oxidoreductase [Candidatus Saccharimonadales bacterium]|jgi:NADH dehydrogenase